MAAGLWDGEALMMNDINIMENKNYNKMTGRAKRFDSLGNCSDNNGRGVA